MDINFNGKTAVVTGASRGIGKDIAIKLAKDGAKVYALARDQTLLDELKSEVPGIETVAVDLSDWTATKNALRNVKDVDLLVNNAGTATLKPLIEVTEEQFDKFGEVTDAVLYLLSDRSSMITGTCLPIDGGYTAV